MSYNPADNRETPRVDRRIQRTKKALRIALVELIQEKGYEAVSVEEITQRADLGRATFYLHYKDKEDLLLEEFIDVARERVEVLSEIPLSAWRQSELPTDNSEPIMPLLAVFQHAVENAPLYRVLLRGESSPRMADRIRTIIAASINAFLSAKQQNDPTLINPQVPVELLAAYFSGALLSSLNWWLEQANAPSPEEMTRMFQRLFFPGVLRSWALSVPIGASAPPRDAAGTTSKAELQI
jgi:AcrR family transcriptional regulator